MVNTIYPFLVKRLNGNLQNLEEFKGEVLLIVNSASQCGFTPQFKELEDLNRKFSSQGFRVLAFPSNDFGEQEPLEGEAIEDFCRTNYGVTFTVFDKIHVKGPDCHALFKFLSSRAGILGTPRWNFYKYLINRRGELVDFYLPFTKPSSKRIEKRIKELLRSDIK